MLKDLARRVKREPHTKEKHMNVSPHIEIATAYARVRFIFFYINEVRFYDD